MKKIAIWISMFLMPFAVNGQTAVIPVYACGNPGVKAVTSGLSSTNYLEGVIPSCLVKVYLTGTTTIATTSPQSPFTANTNGSIPPIYAATGQAYDVVLSGGITPNTYALPVTLTGLTAGGSGSGGSGSVGTAGQLQMVGSTPGSFAPSAVTDNGTNVHSTEPIAVDGPPGFTMAAATPHAGVPGAVVYAVDPSVGYAEVNENDTGYSRVCTAANGICSSPIALYVNGTLVAGSLASATVNGH